MTRGAFYYFIKPPNYSILKGILARAVEQRRLKRELEVLRRRLEENDTIPQLIGTHVSLRRIAEIIEAVKDSESSVLVTGETGTGKEIISRRIHFAGGRRNKPFVAVNCAAIPSNLLESELFGYEKGAFTGAATRRIGKIEEAAGGTLFLDEIGEIGPGIGVKLLRVLQEKEVERLGGNKRVKVDFRLISSTNPSVMDNQATCRLLARTHSARRVVLPYPGGAEMSVSL
jgi:two-component system response regulator HydG